MNYELIKTVRFFPVLLILFFCNQTFAQINTVVHGKVTDANGQPISGASILIKGTNAGTSSDNEGNFTISVPNQKSAVVISSVGFPAQEITVGNRTNLNVQ